MFVGLQVCPSHSLSQWMMPERRAGWERSSWAGCMGVRRVLRGLPRCLLIGELFPLAVIQGWGQPFPSLTRARPKRSSPPPRCSRPRLLLCEFLPSWIGHWASRVFTLKVCSFPVRWQTQVRRGFPKQQQRLLKRSGKKLELSEERDHTDGQMMPMPHSDGV